MRSIKIEFTNAAGQQLAGRLDLPEDERPIAYALFAHCFTCGKDIKAAAYLARALCREKIALMRFDFAGLGQSEGDFADTTLSGNVADLEAAAAYLAQHHQAPQLLIGHSFGGAAILHAARRLSGVKAVVTIAAPYDPQHVTRHLIPVCDQLESQGEAEVTIGGRSITLRRSLLDDLAGRDPAEVVGDLGAALLVMHAPGDQVVSIDNAARIYQAAKHPKSFITLDSADHLLSDQQDARYAGSLIATWAKRYLAVKEQAGIEAAVVDSRVTARTGPEGFYSEIFANGHALVADEPKAYGGTDRGPSPYEYLLTALGACTTMTVQMYARRKEWPLQWAVTRLKHEKIHAQDCADCESTAGKIDHFERELELVGPLDEEQRRRLLEIAEKCPVHKTLHGEVQVKTILREPREET